MKSLFDVEKENEIQNKAKIKKNILELFSLLENNNPALILLDELKNILDINTLGKDKREDQSNENKTIVDGKTFHLYSDGACRGNPGPGAYGYVIETNAGDLVSEGSCFFTKTTNNQMELSGCLEGLEYLNKHFNMQSLSIKIISDSKYVINGLKSWMYGWKRNGWRKADKTIPKNIELWKKLEAHISKINVVNYEWVKGHAGHIQNERCDQLANIAMDKKIL